MTFHEVRVEAGIALLMIHHLFRGLANWAEDLEKIKGLFGGGKKGKMDWLAIIKEVLTKSPELVPEVEKIITDIKATVADAEAIKNTVAPPAAPTATTGAV